VNITLRLETFLLYITYNHLFRNQPVPQEISEAVKLADPSSEISFVEHDPITDIWNLWFVEDYIAECKDRRRLELLGPAKPYAWKPEKLDKRVVLQQQINKATQDGNIEMANILQSALNML